jgi:signal transduction histidine kinase
MIFSFQSIRFRLTSFYILIFFIILVLIASLILWNYHGYLLKKGKSSLRDKSFVAGAWIDFAKPDFNHQADDYVHSQESPVGIRLFDRKGNILGQSSSFPTELFLPGAVQKQIIKVDEPVVYESEDGKYAIAVNNLFANNKICGFVQVVQAKDSILESFKFLLKLMLLSIVVALTLAFVGGIYLVNQMLYPLNKIITTINEIQAEKLISNRLPIINPNDELGRLSLTINSLLDRIDKAMQTQKKFLSDAAHELRTPLTILKGNTEVAMMKEDGNKITFSKNLTEINHLISLTNDLLLMAGFDNRSMKLIRQRFDLTDLLREALLSFEHRFKESQIQLVQNMVDHVLIDGDPILIKRAIYNLLDNSIKYIGNGKVVHVSLVKSNNNGVQLSIKDEGIGIPANKISYIFDRFYRVQEDRNKDIEGTGLGLSIVKSIVDIHGFNIEVDRELNKGTAFTITIN